MSSLVSFSRQTMKLVPPPSIAHILPVFGAGASSGASPKILASIYGCSRQLVRPPSFAPHMRASHPRAPTGASAELSAPRSIVCCPGPSPSPVVVAVCNGRLDGEREILSYLLSKMGTPKAAFFPYISAGDPDLSATAKTSKAAATRSLARGCNFDSITSMSKVVPQLSSLVAFLKPNIEKLMSIVKDAGFRGQRPPRVYNVFISYKQEDTLHHVSHLKSALDRRGIKTFVDSTLEGGVEVQPAIEEAIECSEIAVVIVSQNYHLSPWCLIELEKILECRRKWGLIVLPILRGMDAKDLREQPSHFVENIGQGEKGFKQEQPQQFQKWKYALRELGMIKALPVLCSSVIPEATVIEDAADQISARASHSV